MVMVAFVVAAVVAVVEVVEVVVVVLLVVVVVVVAIAFGVAVAVTVVVERQSLVVSAMPTPFDMSIFLHERSCACSVLVNLLIMPMYCSHWYLLHVPAHAIKLALFILLLPICSCPAFISECSYSPRWFVQRAGADTL